MLINDLADIVSVRLRARPQGAGRKSRTGSKSWGRLQGEGYVVLARLELREDDFDVTGVDFAQDFATQGGMVILGGHARPRFEF